MNPAISQRLFQGSIMIGIALIFLISAFMIEKQDITDPAGASFLPAVITLIMIGCAFLTFRQRPVSLAPIQREEVLLSESEEGVKTEKQEIVDDEKWTKKEYIFVFSYLGFVLLYVVLLPILTFFVDSFIFLVISFYWFKAGSLIKNVLISGGMLATIYVVFTVLFKVIFP